MRQSDHRVRVTRQLIRKALTELLRQKPIQSISVKELCASAGINRGTFYAHYTDVYDLLAQIEDEMLEDFQEALRPLLDLDAKLLTPLKITTRIFQCLRENADVCTVTLGPFGDKNFAARLLGLGRDKCMESYTRFFSGATPKQIAFYYAFVSAGCIGVLEKWLADGMGESAEEIARVAERIMMGGVRYLQSEEGGDDR